MKTHIMAALGRTLCGRRVEFGDRLTRPFGPRDESMCEACEDQFAHLYGPPAPSASTGTSASAEARSAQKQKTHDYSIPNARKQKEH